MRLTDILAAILVAVLWGGNFIAARYGLAHFPPIFLSGLRFALVAALLIPFVPRPTRAQISVLVPISILNALHFSLPYVGMSLGLSIASTAITAQLGTPFSCLLGAIFLRDRLGPWRVMGMVIAFIGMLFIFGAPDVSHYPLAFIAVLCGAFFWASSNVAMKKMHGMGMLGLLAWLSLFTAPQLLAGAYIFEPYFWHTLKDVPFNAAAALAYTVLLSTVIAHGLWYQLLIKHPVSQIAPYSLITPVVGTLLALWFFGEMVTWHIVIGGLITLLGVAIIVIRRPQAALLQEPEPV